MSDRRLGSFLSLLRQGASLEHEFGTHSLGALLSVAELVEQSVYERGSLTPTPDGLTFRLTNPPLRSGAFSSVRLIVDGTLIPPERARFRQRPEIPWRALSEISREKPLELRPGDRTDIAADVLLLRDLKEVTIRLEFRSLAIPPLVWLEFKDALAGSHRP